MSDYKPLFRRIAEENNEIPSIWMYDELPKKVRVQIWREVLKVNDIRDVSLVELARETITFLSDEIGTNSIEEDSSNKVEDLEFFFYKGLKDESDIINTRYALTVIEIIGKYLVYWIKRFPQHYKTPLLQIIDRVNQRLREAKIGWTFNNDAGVLLKVDNDATYQLAVKPAFNLLANVQFKESTDNFIKAFESYQQGGHKNLESAVDYAIKTLESTIRNICVTKGYEVTKNATLKPLVDVLIKNRYLPEYHDDYLNSMAKIMLESGVVRNKMTGHGKEDGKAEEVKSLLNDKLVEFVLSQTASCIVFLVGNLNQN